jgi:hypothetical protein
MTKSAVSYGIERYPGLAGIPRGPKSQVFLVDPVNGSDSNTGLSWLSPLKTVAAAYALTTDGNNDVVLMLGGATADAPAAGIVWRNNYTHLIGLSGDLPGVGQRCRITNTAANDLAVLFTLSGSGCIVKNIQFFDGKDKAEAGACVLVSGSRNYFENVFFAGMGDATAGAPATVSTSYSLKVSGAENFFKNCTIGMDSVVRSDANAELIVSNVRNWFQKCLFQSWSVTAGKFLVSLDNTLDLRWTMFEDCTFFNYSPNWATGITNAFHLPASGETFWVILKGNNQLVGTGMTWADNFTHIYSAEPTPGAGYGVSIAPTS